MSVPNGLGQLVKTETSGFTNAPPATLYQYNALGQLVRSGQDLAGNDALDPASADRIQDTDTLFWQGSPGDGIAAGWWRKQSAGVYPVTDSAVVVTTAVNYTRLTGLGLPSDHGILTAESVAIDIHGNHTVSQTHIDGNARTRTSLVDTRTSCLRKGTCAISFSRLTLNCGD